MTLTHRTDDDHVWPALPYAEWQPTLSTVHMWQQIVGKVKLELSPFLNEWWDGRRGPSLVQRRRVTV